MSKKILSLALVVVMLMSMFAFTTSAADIPSGKIGIRVESNAYVGMPAGEEVTFKFYFVVPDDLDLDTYKHGTGTIPVVFTEGFALNTDGSSAIDAHDARTWGIFYQEYLADSTAVSIASSAKTTAINYANTDDSTRTWKDACLVQMGYNKDNGYSNSTGMRLDRETELFSLSFTTTKTITAEDAIIVPASSYGKSLKIAYNESNRNKNYAAEAVVLDDNTSYPLNVTHETTMGQMKDWDNNVGPFNGGLVGKISNLNLTFNETTKTCNELEKIEVSITPAGGTTTTKEAYTVYKQNDGSYWFRAVVNNMTITDETVLTCQYKVYYDHDNDDSTAAKVCESPEFEVTAKAIYDKALGNFKTNG